MSRLVAVLGVVGSALDLAAEVFRWVVGRPRVPPPAPSRPVEPERAPSASPPTPPETSGEEILDESLDAAAHPERGVS